MDNWEPEKLELHEGHNDDLDEGDEDAMDENHPMWRSERITLNSGSPNRAPSGAPCTDPASLQRCIGTGRRRRAH